MASVHPKDQPRTAKPRNVHVRVHGKQDKVALGERELSEANAICSHITELERAVRLDSVPSSKAIEWVNGQSVELQQRIHRAGLLPHLSAAVNKITPEELVQWYLDSRQGDLKNSSIENSRHRLNRLVKWCKAEGIKDANRLTATHIERFKSDEIAYSATKTALATMKVTKRMFKAAKRQGKLQRDPSADVTTNTGKSVTNHAYVDLKWFTDFVGCIENDDLKTVVMLARLAGARVPSEVNALRWEDINLHPEKPSIRLPNVKTIRTNEAYREVKLYPQLYSYLCDLYQSRYGETDFTTFHSVFHRKGLEHWSEYLIESKAMRNIKGGGYTNRLEYNGAWKRWKKLWQERTKADGIFAASTSQEWSTLGDKIPRVFQACRNSCANDMLTSGVPIQAAAYVLGHKVETLLKHYAKVQKQHRDWLQDHGEIDPFQGPR